MYNVRMKLFFLILPVIFLMGGCAATIPPDTSSPSEDSNSHVTSYTALVYSAEDISALDIYPNLTELDLRGSTCYDDILAYVKAHPNVNVLYDVSIGTAAYPSNTEKLILADGSFSAENLIEMLPYLPMVNSISLPETTLPKETLTSLIEALPDVVIDYTVVFQEKIIPHNTQSIDLSFLSSDHLEEAVQLLGKLPLLTYAELMDSEGKSQLTMAEVRQLMDAAPDSVFNYSFTLYNQNISTADESVEFINNNIGNEGITQIRQMLDILPNCRYLLMDQCNISNEIMSQLRDDYPDTKVVWRIFYGPGESILTDATVFRSIGDLYDSNVKNLKYLSDIVYLDAGHCYALSDLSFVSYMPNLKVAIFSDCKVEDLTPFSNCKKLEYLEIVNCNYLRTLEPLASCVSLKGVNMSCLYTVEELDPLYGLENLERLYFGRHDFPKEEIDEARAALPDCWITDHAESIAWVSFNYSVGWRLDDEHTFAEWYKEIKEVFGYKREIY